MIEVCEEEKTDLLLIAGDLFHRQPLLRELKDVAYLFGKLTHTQVVLIAGNHDYMKKDSYYRTFRWPAHVHMLGGGELESVVFPELDTEVCGFSYHTREIRELPLQGAYNGTQRWSILLLHGGDASHVPFRKEELLNLGYDYIALGHIHKPQMLVKDRIAYPGAPEPVDKNDTGHHGFITGELTRQGCRTRFVPFSVREYKHVEVEVSPQMTGFELKERLGAVILENGSEHIYKLILTGERDPETLFDLAQMSGIGHVIEVVDQTKPAYDFDSLLAQNQNNILGELIREWKDCDRGSVEYGAMCEGVKALMETRRG